MLWACVMSDIPCDSPSIRSPRGLMYHIIKGILGHSSSLDYEHFFVTFLSTNTLFAR